MGSGAMSENIPPPPPGFTLIPQPPAGFMLQSRGAPQQQPAAQPQVTHTTRDGGRVYQMPDGTRAYAGPNFSTTDPAQIDRLMEGATAAETFQSGLREDMLRQHPVASRAAVAVRGVPFIGSYADETVGQVFGEGARDAMRFGQEAVTENRPGQAAALELGGAVAGAVPMAMAAGPNALRFLPQGLGPRMLAGAGLGAAAGGTEGAIHGFGRGVGDAQNRMEESMRYGAMGAAVGGGVGAIAPAVAAGGSAVVRNLRRSDTSRIARELGISPEAARAVRTGFANEDFGAAQSALQRAGPNAMLADATNSARTLLDTAIQTGGQAGRIAGEAVQSRAGAAGRAFNKVLDDVLGPVRGRDAISRGIREGSAGARSAAYDAAYARPIDYSSAAGRALEAYGARLPGAAVRRANELMRLEGVQSAQIMARIADDGSVTFQRMPDVRQWDYITRGLNDVAEAANAQGRLGGTTDMGRATGNLSRAIRTTLRRHVPEYDKALNVAADAIRTSKAAELGTSILSPATTREMVRDGLRGATRAERQAAAQGLRSAIDDTLANVGRVASDPNIDARELQRLVSPLTSRAGREKVEALVGPAQAARLFREMDEAIVTLELRAAIAANSRTAVRTATREAVDQSTQPGALGVLMQGEPVRATKRIVTALTGQTPEALALRQQGIYDEIAMALTQQRGPNAGRALRVIERAMQGQRVTEAQARMVARALGGTTVAVGYPTGSRMLTAQ